MGLTQIIRPLAVVWLTLAFAMAAQAQDRCGVLTPPESGQKFEAWMSARKAKYSSARENASGQYRIPVVVHVIHNGEDLGVGGNIPDAQIISQIAVLNKDYNRLNADATSTPAEFRSVAGVMDIEFVLAKQTPEGQATNGIVRAKGSKTSWAMTDDATLKDISYWAAEDYLNIWVVNLSGSLLGYAQFPVSSTLDGLTGTSTDRLTDGVVIDYTTFGSADDGSFPSMDNVYDKGRTATHEIGHYLGLRHIWGDVSQCSGVGDYVADTPYQRSSTNSCPTGSQTDCTSTHKMYQNYMDYTYDACMNLFTQGQVERMVTVMTNSPRRNSLPLSNGLIEPVAFGLNLELTSIVRPAGTSCPGQVTPQILVTNNGFSSINSAQIKLTVNGTIAETRTFTFSTPLATRATTTVSFNPITLATGNSTTVFQILAVNGGADELADDDTQSLTVEVPASISAPFAESFDTWPTTWKVVNPDAAITWASATAPDGNAANKAAFMNFYNYQNAASASDLFLSPVFDLSSAASPYLTFDLAYARFQNFTDGLQIYVLTDCSADIAGLIPVYDKSGATLATVSTSAAAFVPSSKDQWRKEIVDLRGYMGQSRVRLAFAAVNGSGNNLYLDNIAVVTSITEDVAITEVTEPTPVRCEPSATPVIRLRNNSAVAITSLSIATTFNGAPTGTQDFKTIDGFDPGVEKEFALSDLSLVDGENTLAFEVTGPNGYTDIQPADNTRTWSVMLSSVTDVLPLRENFNDSTFNDRWSVINPQGGIDWMSTSTNYDQSLYVNPAAGSTTGDQAWLVSPSLDLSATTTASLFFDLSYLYATDGGGRDIQGSLQVLASTDCGVTYDHVLFSKTGDDLSTSAVAKTGSPASIDFWKRVYVNLDELVGTSSLRIAFVYTNDKGSNIYLDNIEFYLSDDPSPKSTENPFVVYGTDLASAADFYLTFNLDDRQPVSYQLVDTMGKQVMQEDLTDVLNQTYRVEPTGASSGIYILRLHIGEAFYSTKVYVGR